jgi:hypothetical protein
MAMSREWVVNMLHNLGYTHAAEEAARTLPDTIEMDQLVAFGERHGITRGDMVERMGGSP